MKTRILLIYLFLFTLYGYSQKQADSSLKERVHILFGQEISDTVVLKGSVSTNNGHPLPLVTVLLCNPDSSVLKLATTDSLGRYSFNGLYLQDYLLIFRHLAYKQTSFLIRKEQLGRVGTPLSTSLQNKAVELQDVVVIGKTKARVEKTEGGFSFNLDDRLNKSTLWEVLKQTPFVDVREDGTLGIMGKKGSVVYINGKKILLGGNDLIQMLKNQTSENVKNIEVISSPPSSYDAQGNAGVINIVLRKPPEEGFSGSLSVGFEQAVFSNQRISSNLNFARGKITSQLAIRAGRNKNRIIEDSDIYLESIDTYNHSMLTRKEQGFPVGVNLSHDIAFTKRNVLSFQAGFSHSSQELLWSTRNDFSRIGSAKIGSTDLTTTNQDTYNNFYNVDASDKIQIDTTGGYFSFSGSFFAQTNGTDAPYISVGTGTMNFKTRTRQNLKNYAAKIDFRKKLAPNSQLSTGLKANYSESLNGNQFFNLINETYVANRNMENDFQYSEKIFAAYLSFKQEIKEKFHATAGFRLENTLINGHERIQDSILTKNFLNLFPNVSLTYDLTQTDRLSFDVSNRIMRPAFWELNPSPVFTSPVMYSEGNAFLLPSQATNLELSYLLKEKFAFVLGYGFTKRDFMQFQVSRPGSDTIVFTRYNYGNNKNLNLNGDYTEDFFKKRLKVNINVNANYSYFTGALPDRAIQVSSWQVQTKARVDYILREKSQSQIYISHYYNSPFTSAQGEDFSMQFSEIGFNTKYKNLSIQLRCVDPFNTGIARFASNSPSILSIYTNFDVSRRRAIATLSYRFGNSKARKAKTIETANEEQKNRK